MYLLTTKWLMQIIELPEIWSMPDKDPEKVMILKAFRA